jgi:hypothetical protein
VARCSSGRAAATTSEEGTVNTIGYADARRARLRGRRDALDGHARIPPAEWRALGDFGRAMAAEFLKGYDEAAKAPGAAWFDANGEPWRCGAPTKAGGTCQAIVDRKGYRCARHRPQPPPPHGQLPLWAA